MLCLTRKLQYHVYYVLMRMHQVKISLHLGAYHFYSEYQLDQLYVAEEAVTYV